MQLGDSNYLNLSNKSNDLQKKLISLLKDIILVNAEKKAYGIKNLNKEILKSD